MKGEQQQRLFKERKTFPPAMFRWIAIPTAQVTIENLKLYDNKKKDEKNKDKTHLISSPIQRDCGKDRISTHRCLLVFPTSLIFIFFNHTNWW